MAKIFSVQELIAMLKSARAGGQYVTIYYESDYKMNKYPTDGSERERIRDNFQPRKRNSIKYHFGEDYEKRVAKERGLASYDASDSNRDHIVPNVLMQFKSTGNICFIAMPEAVKELGVYLNGEPISDKDMAYAKRFDANKKHDYYNVSVKNVSEIHIGGNVYECLIGKAAQASLAG